VIAGVSVLLAAVPGEELDVTTGFVFCVPESLFLASLELQVAGVGDFVYVCNESWVVTEVFLPVDFSVFYLDCVSPLNTNVSVNI
jgi:hypothetical protein